ncbi:FKBP-type peptidyl-prolyl cis-trans isomerase [Kibdelosporangium philippinense]|uniref:Peptidyl-prolyl cis-trans isomerase n=1 Tax=Kibdelosporangium philippinense TaxID=211113 RepID=A0ABS8ZSV7_9PSEU|nr:FKBP-type peptidyl-prolyl cis-trans isomerase [Kibdelosporangium philippinense]MCE7010672.1 FKBP-type peptidyl-prolyl cis-trans isomerase [Kibdelosporangium philippinense]
MRIAGKVTMVSVALVAAATLSACANSEQASTAGTQTSTRTSTPPPPSATSTPPSATSTASGPECTADDVKVSGDFGQKPTITIPTTCQPPKQLLSKDLKAGTGAEAKAGGSVAVNYQLVTWSDKKEVDGNFGGGEPFTVGPLGQARVIKGWNEGLIGITANSRRLLVIPPDKAYGPDGQSGIKGGETLVFVIDALQVS